MLYVPGSNPRMLEKSFASPADSICYDLEDAVAPGKKVEARRTVCELLDVSIKLLRGRLMAGRTEAWRGDHG
jgi:citrate lyase beta subunit